MKNTLCAFFAVLFGFGAIVTNAQELAYTPAKSTFQLWAPTAEDAVVSLYSSGSGGNAIKTVTMQKADSGYWRCSIDGDRKGMFYTFKIKYKGRYLAETPGIWAKAVGVNGNRAAIIDMAETNPAGWENDTRPPLAHPADIIIYEMHHRDFSIDPNSGMKNKGKFMALTETGTKSADGLSTGLDHLKELGINCVQMLPSYDFDFIDETTDSGQNWGYCPKNFNVPDGSYATDPYTPATRIKEFKSMVQTLHRNGIRVIMDVVYHQTSYTDANMQRIPFANGGGSCLDLTYPDFFYRYYPDGVTPSTASHTSYDIASEKPEVRNFIVESVKYWAAEYHVDGFRFDRMGLLDLTTMNLVRSELDRIDPTIFIVGEGWNAASALPAAQRTTIINGLQSPGIAVFSGDIRDALKGGNANSSSKGFVQGSTGEAEMLKFCIGGATQRINSKEPYANNPGEISNYASCHDGCCLLDFLTATSPDATPDQLMRYNFLAQTIVFTAQGAPLILSGEELYHTKHGYNDTNGKPDSINQILWANKKTYSRVFDYYRNLIALRKAHPAFRMPTTQDVAKNLTFLSTPSDLQIAFTLNGAATGDSWKNILVAFNGSGSAAAITIPAGTWTVVCDDAAIDLDGLGQVVGGSVTLKPSSAFIAYIK